jgi:hypothetical protein
LLPQHVIVNPSIKMAAIVLVQPVSVDFLEEMVSDGGHEFRKIRTDLDNRGYGSVHTSLFRGEGRRYW